MLSIRDFEKIKVGVIGDIIADIYVYGKQHKLSREAPVIVAKYEQEELFLGGAGNVTNNLSSLGAKVYLFSVIGTDKSGRALKEWLDYFSIDTDGVVITNQRITPSKTRYLVGDSHTTKRQVVRFDKEPIEPLSEETKLRILRSITEHIPAIDIWIVSDYGYGVVEDINKYIQDLATGCTVVVDSRHRLLEFADVEYITPNESEVEEAIGVKITDDASLVSAVTKLISSLRVKGVLVTQGNKGMALFDSSEGFIRIPACNSNEIVDVTGAGDTVTSVFTLGIAAGYTPLEAAKLANYAASIVVMKIGPSTVSREELEKYYE